MNVIYRANYILPMTDAGVINNGEVWVEEGRIREIGQGISNSHPEVEVCELGAAAILPGFVNAHSHIEYTLSSNTCDGLNFWDWIDTVGFRRDKAPTREMLLASARYGAAQLAYSGVTCLGDCSYSGIAAEPIDELGMRGVVFKEIFGQSMGSEYPARVALALDEIRKLQSNISERVRIGISPHSVYTTNDEVLKLCAEACAELDLPVCMHAAETRAEEEYTVSGTGPIADLQRRHGREPMVSGLRPLGVLEKAGLLRKGVSLAHCVHLNDDEIEILAASGVGIAHCSRSNAYLGGGIAPLTKFRQVGACVGLGTDSAASCMKLDFFEEMRFALGLHRAVAEDAGVLLAKDILQLATRGGAEVLGLGNEIGRLQPGMRADMIAVSLDNILPGEDIHLALVSRTPEDVVLRMVDGQLVELDVKSRFAELVDLMEHQNIG